VHLVFANFPNQLGLPLPSSALPSHGFTSMMGSGQPNFPLLLVSLELVQFFGFGSINLAGAV